VNNPWDIKTDSERTADSLITFIIFCEDTNSEPIYLKFFETSHIKINIVKNQKSKLENIVNAICHCQENGLLDPVDPAATITDIDTYIWCVFDRDFEETEERIAKGNVAFDQSIKMANENGISVAWSNDSFELWVLLHFQDIDNSKPLSRKYFYNSLTEIFKKIPDPNDDLKKALNYAGFSYKSSMKSANNFRFIVRPELIKNTQIAIERANTLLQHFEQKNINPHLMSPCTTMQILVKQLLKDGKKVL